MNNPFIPKKALITGASSGIGKAFAQALANDGWQIVLVARRENTLEEVRKSLPGTGHETLVADLATPAGIENVAFALKSGEITMLINNAGFGWIGDSTEMPDSTLEEMLSVNIAALTKLSLEFLKAAPHGSYLLNVASVIGLVPFPPQTVYAATKAFVVSFTCGLWSDWSPKGYRVLAVCPGATDTEFFVRAGAARVSKFRQMQSPDDVVNDALKAAFGGSGPVKITGLHNRIFVFLGRHVFGIPRITKLLGTFGRKF
jgi:short-subunit dehydrogenase